MKFKTIIADVPAPFRVWSKETGMGRSAESHYRTMTWQALNELGPLVRAVADNDCALFLWVCPPLLEEMRALREAWGFFYKTKAFNWIKLNRKSMSFFFGMGYWTRANSEDVWLCVRGCPGRIARNVRQIVADDPVEWSELPTTDVMARIGRHSAKPEAIQDAIERLVPGPYLEMFARRARPGWTCIGGDVTGRDIREDLALLRDAPSLPADSLMPARSTASATAQQSLWG
ncbi:MAG: MT-A70 family methyltransferase [Chloroflexota bacterium]|mgnify:CR=1 FL=1